MQGNQIVAGRDGTKRVLFHVLFYGVNPIIASTQTKVQFILHSLDAAKCFTVGIVLAAT